MMSKHADVTLTCGDEVSSLLSLLNVVMAAHGRPMANDGRLFCLKCVCWSKTGCCIVACIFCIAGLRFTALPVVMSLW